MARSLGRLDATLGGPAHYSPRGQGHDRDAEDYDDEVRQPRQTTVEDSKLFLEETKSRKEQHRESEADKDAPHGPPQNETSQVLQGLDRFLFDVLDEEVTDFFEVPLDACSSKEASPRRIPHGISLLSAFSNEIGGAP